MELTQLSSRLRIRPLLSSRVLSRSPWVCTACKQSNYAWRRHGSSVATRQVRSMSSEAAHVDKPYYVTTPIFYVNASPHIGHMYSMVLADVLKRWKVLQGERALLLTGTDEHGMKVQRAAALNDVEPKQMCDTNSAVFRELAERAQIDNDFFIRTTDPDHKEAVRFFWDRLVERGFIYENSHKGWYCVSDETFYPESMIEKKIDPMNGGVCMASVESGNPVEWLEEKTYFFRMTALKDRLLEFYARKPEWVVPASRMSEVVDWVTNNLEDLSVSRPASRLDWGIRVPGDESQTIYVWLDALVNYITKARYPVWPPGESHLGGWPADVQVIGKDILRFHCVYWPALLLAIDIEPPMRILSHAHFTLGRKKMSKSLGNVVNPFLAIDRFGVDAMRFFLVGHGGIQNDADYTNETIVEMYKKHLQRGLGNLAHRAARSRFWTLKNIVHDISEDGLEPLTPLHAEQVEHLNALVLKVRQSFDALNPGEALGHINESIAWTNQYIHKAAPWKLKDSKKENDPAGAHKFAASVYLVAESLRFIGILMQPFIPEKAGELLDMLGVAADKRTAALLAVGADLEYGLSLQNQKAPRGTAAVNPFDSLFPPLAVET